MSPTAARFQPLKSHAPAGMCLENLFQTHLLLFPLDVLDDDALETILAMILLQSIQQAE